MGDEFLVAYVCCELRLSVSVMSSAVKGDSVVFRLVEFRALKYMESHGTSFFFFLSKCLKKVFFFLKVNIIFI